MEKSVTPQDHVALSQLTNRYAQALDRGDGAAFAECFTPGGVLDGAGDRVAGTAALAQWCTGRQRRGRHLPAGFVAEVDGDAAALTSTCLFHDGGSPAVVLTILYSDRLERAGGTWRFARRSITEIGGLPPAGPA
jgi:hypothetical protein